MAHRPATLLGALALLLSTAVTAGAAGLLEGGAVEQRFRYREVSHLIIDGGFLDVRVFGAERQDVEAQLSLSARMLRRNQPVLVAQQIGRTLRLRLDRNQLPVGRAALMWGPNLILSVPRTTQVEIRTTSGTVAIHRLANGNAQVRTNSGDIYVGDLQADLELVAGSGSISVQRISGDVRATTATGRISAVGVAGSVSVRTQEGHRLLRRIQGDIDVGEAGGLLEVQQHQGSLRIAPG